MATRAEMFRYRQERMGPKRPKRPARRRRDFPVDTAKPGISATDKRARGNATGMSNRSKAAGRKAAYELEERVGPGRPSRKSTRHSANKLKPDHLLWNKQLLKKTSPSERARRGR